MVNLERWEINKFIAREVRDIGSDCLVLVNQMVNLERWEINNFIAREVHAVGSDCLRISLDVVVTSIRNYKF